MSYGQYGTVQTEGKKRGDLVRWMVDENRGIYCTVDATIKNTLGSIATLSAPLGMPLKYVTDHFELLASGEESLCAGLLLEENPIAALADAATTAQKYCILVRGPAVIDKDQLPTADGAATPVNYTMADLLAALVAMGIIYHLEPSRLLTADS